jgi:hypothetical protein
MIPLPADSKWKVSQLGDLFGHVVRTKNMNFSKTGYASLARKAMTLFTYGVSLDLSANTDPAFQGTFLGAVTDSQYVYVLTAAELFHGDITDNLFTLLEASSSTRPAIGFDSDIVMYNATPHISGGQYVAIFNTGGSSSWDSRPISGLSTLVPHPLCVFEGGNTLLVGNGNQVRQYNTSYVDDLTNRLALPSEHYVTCIRAIGSKIFVGTRNIFGGDAKLFVWNGAGTQAQAVYSVGADWVYSMCEYESSLAIVTSAGQIRRFSGGGFDDLANFPVYYTNYAWTSTNDNKYLVGKVASRGLQAAGNRLYINIDGSLNNSATIGVGKYLPDMPSGLWVFDPDVGLYHKSGVNFDSRLRLTPTAANSSYLTFSTAHQAKTGDPVLSNNVSLTGITSGQVYYAIVDSGASTTTCRLALSPEDAKQGRYITIGGTASTDAFVFDRYETLGTPYLSDGYAGGICVLGRARAKQFYATDVLFGAGKYDGSLYRATLNSLGSGRNIGHLITPRIPSSQVTDSQKKLYAFIEPLIQDTDKIVIKYRKASRSGLPTPPCFSGNATWTSTTTFTIDTSLKDFKSVLVGDEIEVIRGNGAGYTAHITAINTDTTTYAVTVDETMPVTNGDTFDFVVDNWTKSKVITNADENNLQGFSEIGVGQTSPWIQYKIEFRGRGTSLRQLQAVSDINKPSV